jgi:serine protease Do
MQKLRSTPAAILFTTLVALAPLAVAQKTAPSSNAIKLCQGVGVSTPELSKVAEVARNATVLITTNDGLGTGFLIESDTLLTAYHVVRGATQLQARFATRRLGNFQLELIGFDERRDLALLKLKNPQSLSLPILSLAGLAAKANDGLVAIGNSCDSLLKAKFGSVIGLGKDISPAFPQGLLESDAPLAPGDSGGPALNDKGEVIGVISAIGVENNILSSYIVPLTSNASILTDLRAGVKREIPILGVGLARTVAVEVEDGTRGLLVGSVRARTGAGLAGVRPGDLIVSVGGKVLADFEALRGYLKDLEVGDSVEVVIYRAGERLTLTVKLGSYYL